MTTKNIAPVREEQTTLQPVVRRTLGRALNALDQVLRARAQSASAAEHQRRQTDLIDPLRPELDNNLIVVDAALGLHANGIDDLLRAHWP